MAYHRAHGVDTRIVRIFNTYGERMRPRDGRVVPALIGQALAGEPMTVFGDGSQTRSFCYVSDLVDGIYRLLLSDVTEPVNIGNPAELSVLEFARTIQNADRRRRARSSSSRCPWTTRRSASRTSPRRGEAPGLGAAGGPRGRASEGRSTYFRADAGVGPAPSLLAVARRWPRPGQESMASWHWASSSGVSGCRKT